MTMFNTTPLISFRRHLHYSMQDVNCSIREEIGWKDLLHSKVVVTFSLTKIFPDLIKDAVNVRLLQVRLSSEEKYKIKIMCICSSPLYYEFSIWNCLIPLSIINTFFPPHFKQRIESPFLDSPTLQNFLGGRQPLKCLPFELISCFHGNTTLV